MEIIDNKAVRFKTRTRYYETPAPHRAPKKYASVAAILAHTAANGTCMEWQGALNKDGYAACGRGGLLQSCALHREVHRLVTGETPPVVMHTCDNRKCINPQHLKSGTAKTNHDDKIQKQRQARGAANGNAKWTATDVAAMRTLRADGVPAKTIAASFNISLAHLWRVLTHKNWT